MIKIGYITNTEDKHLHEMLKFMRKRNVSHRNIEEVEDLLKQIPNHKIELLPDTKTIAGFLCNKAIKLIVQTTPTYTICGVTRKNKNKRTQLVHTI